MKVREAVGKIPPIYKMLAGLLFLFGMLVFCKKAPYVKVFEENQHGYQLSFLQEGQYELELTYVGFEPGERLQVYSNAMTDSRNQVGVSLAEVTVQEHAGIVAIPFSLPRGVHDLNVTTDSGVGYFAGGKVQSVRLQNRDSYYIAFLLWVAAFLALFLGWKDNLQKYRAHVLVCGIAMLASIPLFSDFLYEGFDMQFHLARIEGIYQAMRAGDFPVRLNPVQNAGYGDLSAVMYPQLFLYPAAALRFFGVSLMLCYKTLLAGMNLCSAYMAYYCGKNVCRSGKIGIWASVFYTFASYRIIDIYMRHALGEALAMAFLPLVVWGTYEILWGDRKKWYLLAFGMTGVLQSHVLSTQMCALFMVFELILCLVKSPKREWMGRICSGMMAMGVTILLNASFLVPFLYFSGQKLNCFYIENNFPEGYAYFTQLFAMFLSTEHFSLSPGSTEGEMAITVGSVLLFGAILFCANQAGKRGQEHTGHVGRHCLAYGVIALFLSSWLFPWEKLLQTETLKKIITPLGFSWRFLGIATIMLCLVSAIALVEASADRAVSSLFAAVSLGLVICSTCYGFDMICQHRSSLSDKMELEGTDYSDGMYMYHLSEESPVWHNGLSREEAYIRCVGSAEVTFSDYEKRGTNIRVTVNNESNYNGGDGEALLVFPLCYYPGYVIKVDGETVETRSYEDPVPFAACALPEQTAQITVSYEGLWFFKAGDIVTLITAAGLIVFAWRKRFILSSSGNAGNPSGCSSCLPR